MQTITLPYQKQSPKDQMKRDKIQFAGGTFSFIIAYIDNISQFTDWTILIPVFSFLVATINIIIVIFYNKLLKKNKTKIETWVLRLNGMMMFITALSYRVTGGHLIPYVYLLLAIAFFFLLPYIQSNSTQKMQLVLDGEKILVKRLFFKPVIYNLDKIESFDVEDELLKLKITEKKKPLKFYIENTEYSLQDISTLLTL